jgi:diguanylate cyclase (GGDEF)-like protein
MLDEVIGMFSETVTAAAKLVRDMKKFGSTTYDLASRNWSMIRNESSSLPDRIEELNHDLLTGLPGRRRGFEEFKSQYLAVLDDVEKSGETAHMACLFIDADNFKRANDTYDHSFGDRVLQSLAEVIKSNTRNGEDVVYVTEEKYMTVVERSGGDEFIAIGRIAKPGDGMTWADRIRDAVDRLEIPVPGNGSYYHQTVSIGICEIAVKKADAEEYKRIFDVHSTRNYRYGGRKAVLDDEGKRLVEALLQRKYDELYKPADIAMYRAKHNGKNRVEEHHPLDF